MKPEHRDVLAYLRKKGYCLVWWGPDELVGLDKGAIDEMSEMLTAHGEDFIQENVDDDEGHCTTCNGSGEGMYDGTRCRSCNGSGVPTSNKEYDEC